MHYRYPNLLNRSLLNLGSRFTKSKVPQRETGLVKRETGLVNRMNVHVNNVVQVWFKLRSKETVSRQQSTLEACLKAFQHIFMAHKTRSIMWLNWFF